MGLALGLKQLSVTVCLLHFDGMFRQSGELVEHIADHKHSSSCAFVTAVEAAAASSVSRGLLREGKVCNACWCHQCNRKSLQNGAINGGQMGPNCSQIAVKFSVKWGRATRMRVARLL